MKKESGFVIFLSVIGMTLIKPKLTFFTDEVNFNLLGLQNNRYWSSENPHALIQLLYKRNIGVWCVISAHWIVGLIFYERILVAQ
jgi:hypothetical protein